MSEDESPRPLRRFSRRKLVAGAAGAAGLGVAAYFNLDKLPFFPKTPESETVPHNFYVPDRKVSRLKIDVPVNTEKSYVQYSRTQNTTLSRPDFDLTRVERPIKATPTLAATRYPGGDEIELKIDLTEVLKEAPKGGWDAVGIFSINNKINKGNGKYFPYAQLEAYVKEFGAREVPFILNEGVLPESQDHPNVLNIPKAEKGQMDGFNIILTSYPQIMEKTTITGETKRIRLDSPKGIDVFIGVEGAQTLTSRPAASRTP